MGIKAGGTVVIFTAGSMFRGTALANSSPSGTKLRSSPVGLIESKYRGCGRPLNKQICDRHDDCAANLKPNSFPDCVFHTLHEVSHIRHCIFTVFLHQFHDGGSYDDTI